MLNNAKSLKGYKLHSRDGDLGSVKEFYFDDRHWTIRYLVADTGNWLSSRQVLISPYALLNVNKEQKYIGINLTKKQIENSPPLDSDKPVSKQFEDSYFGYYGYPRYWGGPLMWGDYPNIERNSEMWRDIVRTSRDQWDPNLRSTRNVGGYYVEATDGAIGHVADFIVDDHTWAIRYLVVDTMNWWPGKKVLISPQWIERVSWPDLKVFINLSRENIRESPAYTESSLLNRDYEKGLYRYYNRKDYWSDERAA